LREKPRKAGYLHVMPQNPERHRNLVALIIGVLFMLTGAIGLIGTLGAYVTDTDIQRNGLAVQAHLVKKVFVRASDGESDYMLDYWFQTPAGRFDASRSVNKELWNTVQEGQLIEVKYSENNPKRNFPVGAGVTSPGVVVFVSVFSFAFAGLGAGLVWSYFHRDRTEA
jgi:hypothetical protein